jgi:hypothetical protein
MPLENAPPFSISSKSSYLQAGKCDPVFSSFFEKKSKNCQHSLQLHFATGGDANFSSIGHP